MGRGGVARAQIEIAGVAHFARVSQGKGDHGRAGPDWLASVMVEKNAPNGEWAINPMIKLLGRREAIFVSRSGATHDSPPTVPSIFLIDDNGDNHDSALPQTTEDFPERAPPIDPPPPPPTTAPPPPNYCVRGKSTGPYPVFNWEIWRAPWRFSPSRLDGQIEDARRAPALILLGKGCALPTSNPAFRIPTID